MFRSQKGFTLIELLLVISIVGIFSALAVVNLRNSVAVNDLNSAADQLAINMRAMQQLSLQKATSDTANDVNMTITTTSYTINNFGTTLITTTLPNNITTNGSSTITYDPYTLSNNLKGKITLTSAINQQKRTIVIASETGRIRIDASSNPAYRTEEQ